MRQPQAICRALAAGIALLTLIYLVVSVAYFYALPIGDLRGVSRVAERRHRTCRPTESVAGLVFVALVFSVYLYSRQ